jgi:hypothetical protein
LEFLDRKGTRVFKKNVIELDEIIREFRRLWKSKILLTFTLTIIYL